MSTPETFDDAAGSEIAIIGMAGRFPGAADVAAFWQNLRDGVESIRLLTDEELVAAGLDLAATRQPNYVRAVPVLADIDLFDAAFFGYTPREAEIMDPQQRFFLECSAQALEDAGYDPDRYRGPIGVYAGVSMSSYLINLYSNREFLKTASSFQITIGNDKDHLPTRVSYKLNLRGPSITVQTTCSTSLVAVHLACQSLLNGECDMALAGGVSIKVPQHAGYVYQPDNINSPDGHCRPFDAKAQGTVKGSGVGVVVLKRLADALADGDHIAAVIKGSALNNDGSLKVGYTAPSIEGQAQVIADALSLAEVEADSIGYIEAHGTATAIGDPIEIAALTKAFRATTRAKNFCAVGSVKSNIGHLDAAAGVAGLIKTVLALQHRQLPPSLHYEQPNPKIDFANSPFYVNATLSEWTTDGAPRRAGVSSFGIGGTNAHVIVEEAPAPADSSAARPAQLLLLSAKTASALEAATANLAEHLRRQPAAQLADVAYTLQVGRKAFNHRRALVCRDAADALDALATMDAGRVQTAVLTPGARSVVFMFPGQGAQTVNMGRALYEQEAAFRAEVDRCAELLKAELELDLRTVLYPRAEESEAARARLTETWLTQPALFVVEYALAQLWLSWGVKPAALIGHSIGEYVAACLAGVFSLEDALRLVAARGRLMQQLPAGAMLAVPLGEDELTALLTPQLSLAAVNAPGLCVAAGPAAAIAELEERLRAQGVAARRLQTSHAFHSAMMEPMLAAFTARVERVKLKPPQIPYISNVTGARITPEEATDAHYWTKHLRQTVRFAAGVATLLSGAPSVLLEVGPGQTLSTLVRRQVQGADTPGVVASLARRTGAQTDAEDVLKALGQLWLRGVSVDWAGFYSNEQRRRVPLPTYPFERQRYWVGPGTSTATGTPQAEVAPASLPATEAAHASEVVQETIIAQVFKEQTSEPAVAAAAQPNGAGQTAQPDDARQQIVSEQLRLMAEQLAVLRRRGAHT
ncbi:MAG TPA: type I polyketide synthase [Pyrinomonadaceae bacterium]|jgi:acyl transferase domain-containing protein